MTTVGKGHKGWESREMLRLYVRGLGPGGGGGELDRCHAVYQLGRFSPK